MTQAVRDPAVIPTGSMVRALVAVRVFFGLDWLSNAVAKLLGKANYDFGFTTFNLVDRGTAGAILHQSVTSTWIAPLRVFYADVIVANYGFFQWFLTAAELAIAVGLLFGILSRVAALAGLCLLTPIWFMLLTTNQYFWTYPLDLAPLVLLAIVPTGRAFGFDGALAARFNRMRWPF
jgi:uncharacterized membrane protein YphA (DoxX/SURF4 family)